MRSVAVSRFDVTRVRVSNAQYFIYFQDATPRDNNNKDQQGQQN